MRLLTLTQPWATLMALGLKRNETRSWWASYRGPVAIHAAFGFPAWARELCWRAPFRTELAAAYRRETGAAGVTDADLVAWLPRGVIVAVGELTDVQTTEEVREELWSVVKHDRDPEASRRAALELAFGDYSPGRYALAFRDVIRLRRPIRVTGAQGLRILPDEVVERIRREIRVAPEHAVSCETGTGAHGAQP